MELAMKWL